MLYVLFLHSFQKTLDFLNKTFKLNIRMRHRLIKSSLFILLVVLGSILWSSARITSFNARRDDNSVILDWATDSESNLSKFDIERSSDQIRWLKIGETRAAGESGSRQNYSYRDNTIFKASTNNFYYRLVLIDQAGQASPYDVIVSISGSSGIRHTWGSVKAMFR